MTENEKAKFCEMMFGAFEIYDKDLTEKSLEVWFYTLKRYSVDEIRRAMSAHLQDADDGRFPPKPANIIKHLGGSEKQKHEQLESTAQMQWLNVTNAISRCGTWRSPNFKDPITGAVVNSLGGWPALCSKTTRELEFMQKNFVSTYMSFESKPLDQLPCHVAGLEDIQDRKREQGFTLGHLQKGLEDYEKRKAS